MDIAKLVLEFLKVLIWPTAVLTSFIIFRAELKSLAESLRRIKLPGGTELEWQQKIKAAEEAAEKVENSPRVLESTNVKNDLATFVSQSYKHGLLASPSNYDFNYYREIAERDRNLSLAGLRMELERMLQNMANFFNIEYDKMRTSTGRLSRLLEKEDIFEKTESELLGSIISVANAALHGREVSLFDADRTIESAEVFLDFYVAFMSGAMDRTEVEQANNSMQQTANASAD